MAYIWIDFYFYQLGSILTFASDYIHFEHMWFSICVYEVGILTLMLESRPVIGWVPLNQILNCSFKECGYLGPIIKLLSDFLGGVPRH